LKSRDIALGSISNPVVIAAHHLQCLTMEMACEVAVQVVDGDEMTRVHDRR